MILSPILPNDDESASSSKWPMRVLDPRHLVERSFFLEKEHGQRLSTRIVKNLDDFEGFLARYSTRIKCVYSMKDDTIEEIFTYNKFLDHIDNYEEDDLVE